MDYKAANIKCIERITDEVVQRRLYSIIKKADKKSRCAPKTRDAREIVLDDIANELCASIRNRLAR